jgi:hypothetical protein
MNSGSRTIQKAKSPKDIADMLRELHELRIRVSRAELAAARRQTTDGETGDEGNGHGPAKPTDRSRTH